MVGAIKIALAEARRAVEPMIRTRPSADRRWCYVPTEEIHEASQAALRGAGLELFVEGSTIEGEVLTVTYRLYKTEGEAVGHHEEYRHSIVIDRGERRTTLTAGALAVLDRRVRMALLDIVSLPADERQAAERPASAPQVVNPYIRREPGPVEVACGPSSYTDDHAAVDATVLSAEADAALDEITGEMPVWAEAQPEPDPVEVWKRHATAAWVEASKVCANAGLDKPDISAVIETVAGSGADADDLDVLGWERVVVELGQIKERAVQAIVEGVT